MEFSYFIVPLVALIIVKLIVMFLIIFKPNSKKEIEYKIIFSTEEKRKYAENVLLKDEEETKALVKQAKDLGLS